MFGSRHNKEPQTITKSNFVVNLMNKAKKKCLSMKFGNKKKRQRMENSSESHP